MGFLKASGRRFERHQSMAPLSTYHVGQRTVQLYQLADGHVRWVCNCEDYAALSGSSQGAWCKHVAKASAIRSIERLTGARVVARSRGTTVAPVNAATTSPIVDVPTPIQAALHSH